MPRPPVRGEHGIGEAMSGVLSAAVAPPGARLSTISISMVVAFYRKKGYNATTTEFQR
jgi:hypothetical protein